MWTFLGAMIIAAFFLTAFFRPLSPIGTGDPGAVLLLIPLLTGFLLGILLTEEEIVVAAGAGVLAALLAVALIALFVFSPVLARVATLDRAFAAFSVSQVFLSTILLFPLVVVGAALGRGIGDSLLPPGHVKAQLEELREETRRWHAALEKIEGGPGSQKPPEERKD